MIFYGQMYSFIRTTLWRILSIFYEKKQYYDFLTKFILYIRKTCIAFITKKNAKNEQLLQFTFIFFFSIFLNVVDRYQIDQLVFSRSP